MDIQEPKAIVDALNKRAQKAGDSGDALRLSQAALNVANSYCTLGALKRGH